MRKNDFCDCFGVAGDELDYVWRKTCFKKDGVEKIVGCNCGRRGLPHDDVAHESRSGG